MKTRNAGVPKPSATAKKTPPLRKPGSKAQPSPSVETPKTADTRRTSARAAKLLKKTETTPVTASERRQASAEDSAGTATPIARRTSGTVKTPASVYVAALAQSAKVKGKGNASNKKKKVDIVDVELTEEEVMAEYNGEPAGMEETTDETETPAVEKVGVSAADEKGVIRVEVDSSEDEEDPIEMEESVDREVAKSSENALPYDEGVVVELVESVNEEVAKSSENLPPCDEAILLS